VAVVTGEMPSLTEVANAVPKPTKEKPAPDAAPKDAGSYGFKVQNVSKNLADKLDLKDAKGVVVTDVTGNSPAAAAGVQKDDLITEVDSQPVDDTASFKSLVDSHESDKGLLLFINRKGQKTYAIVQPK
jgi:serine protease Do